MSLPWIKVFPRIRTHLKTEKLGDALGRKTGVHHLVIDLWLWAAEECASGDLSGVSDRIIARKAGWRGDPAKFVAALVEVGLMDTDRRLHDWDEHQPAHVAAATEATGEETKAQRRRRLDRERKARKPKRNKSGIPHAVPHDEADSVRNGCGTDAETVRKVPESDGLSARAEIEIQIQTETGSVPVGTGRPADAGSPPEGDPGPTTTDRPTQPTLTATDPPKAEKPKRDPVRERELRLGRERLRDTFRKLRPSDPKADFDEKGKGQFRNSIGRGRTLDELDGAIRTLHEHGTIWERSQPLDWYVTESAIQRAAAIRNAPSGPSATSPPARPPPVAPLAPLPRVDDPAERARILEEARKHRMNPKPEAAA